MNRLASLIVAGAVVVAGFAVYAEPPADPGDDPPVLLKKKGAPEIQDPVPPPADDKDKDKDKDKKPDDAPKPNPGDAQPDPPQQDPDEVLNRATKDMHRAEDRLANKEIDDGTRQAQDDALKDLDQLIDLSENPPESKEDQSGGGGGAGGASKSDPSKSASSKSDPSRSASKSGSSGSSGSSGRKTKGKGKGKGTSKGQGSSSSGDRQPSGGKPDQQPGDPSGKSANGGNGNGGKDVPPLKDRNADLYKDVWGHLPETLRAEMNAYSGAKGFMPEYEALIRKYYSTIAEQGRRQGD